MRRRENPPSPPPPTGQILPKAPFGAQERQNLFLGELRGLLPYLTLWNKHFAFIPPNVLPNCVPADGSQPSAERNPVRPCIISS